MDHHPSKNTAASQSGLNEALERLIKLAGLPDQETSIENITHAIEVLENNAMQKKPVTEIALSQTEGSAANLNRLMEKQLARMSKQESALVVGTLGAINFQLKIMLSNHGYEVKMADAVDTAIEIYKSQDFGLVIIDLFMPSDQEGFAVLEALKRLAMHNELSTRFIVLSNHVRNNKIQYLALGSGADYYFERTERWQEHILSVIDPTIDKSLPDLTTAKPRRMPA